MKTYAWMGIVALTLVLAGCNKDPKSPGPASVKMTFQHTLCGIPLALGTYQAINDTEQLKVERLKYYLSNVRLKTTGGNAWAEEDSYHLVQVGANGMATTVIGQMPEGDYDQLEFSFGVDSAKNGAVDYDGDLNPSFGMAWDWVTGYKYFLMEGKCKLGAREQALVWHIGRNENYRKMTHIFPSTAVQGGDTLRLNFTCAVDSLLLKPNNFLPLARHHDVMDSRDTSTQVANNFADAFIKMKP